MPKIASLRLMIAFEIPHIPANPQFHKTEKASKEEVESMQKIKGSRWVGNETSKCLFSCILPERSASNASAQLLCISTGLPPSENAQARTRANVQLISIHCAKFIKNIARSSLSRRLATRSMSD